MSVVYIIDLKHIYFINSQILHLISKQLLWIQICLFWLKIVIKNVLRDEHVCTPIEYNICLSY